MKNGWNKTYPHKIHMSRMPGVFSANTTQKRTIFLYANSVADAYTQARSGLMLDEEIVSASRAK